MNKPNNFTEEDVPSIPNQLEKDSLSNQTETKAPPVNQTINTDGKNEYPPAPTLSETLPNSVYTPKRYTVLNIILVLFSIVAVLVWAGVGLLYFDNQRLKTDSTVASDPDPTVTPTVNPNKVTQEEITIVAGNVVRNMSDNEPRVLVNKEEFPLTGLAGFARATVSPDATKICFESLSPSAKPGIYMYDMNTAQSKEVSPTKERCIWAADSSKIFYETTSPSNTRKDIYQHILLSSEERSLTGTIDQQGEIRRYSIDRLNSEDNTLLCTIEIVKDNQPDKPDNRTCKINLETAELTESQPES